MLGKMMHQPLTISSLVAHAARYHGGTEIVSVETDGATQRSDWATVERNARRLASALRRLGLEEGDRCATIAWNNRRHLEIYFGVSGGGMVCHTINPRLSPETLIYIMNHAEDRVLFVDTTFLPAVSKLRPLLKTMRHVVSMGPRDDQAAQALDGLLFYDELIAEGDAAFDWPDLDEGMASSLCYTSGTTGHPKGVLYSHRSTVLHSLAANGPDGIAISARDTVMPVVPMFHVNAWGVPYIAAAQGARLVLPGPKLDGESLARVIDGERVTLALGVPTIWMGLLSALRSGRHSTAGLTRTIVGGSALPASMLAAFRDEFGIELVHAWGMTETSPLGTLNQLLAKHLHLPTAEQNDLRLGQGRPPYGVELRIVDGSGAALPRDGRAAGSLQIRGHWIVDGYYGMDENALTADGWFDTGDVATLDVDGFLVIRDRSKDMIKSGGEWISSVELENIAIGHPAIANAAVIGVRHSKWDERPIVVAVAREGAEVDAEALRDHYARMVPAWQIPDRVVFVDSLPLGGTGKVLKTMLRDTYADILIEPSGDEA